MKEPEPSSAGGGRGGAAVPTLAPMYRVQAAGRVGQPGAEGHRRRDSPHFKGCSSGPPWGVQEAADGGPGPLEQRLLTLGCPSRRTLWRTWQNFQLRMELLGSGSPMA